MAYRWVRAIGALVVSGLVASCQFLVTFEAVPENTGGAGGNGGMTNTDGGGGTTATTTGGGTTSSSSSGTGCTTAADCEAPTEDCKVATCDTATGDCGVGNAPDGTEAQDQVAGDCSKNVCSGGVVVEENDDSDVEDDAKDCTTDACSAGMPTHDPISSGACDDDGGAVCDDEGMGLCVECNTDAHCLDNPAGNTKCADTHVCVPASCGDMTLNGSETDVDCGGPMCGKCADDLDCMVPGDCQSNHCGGNAKCVPGTCGDGILNNMQLGETDVDCGGTTCPACAFDKTCDVNADCIGGVCTGDKCAATCTDTAKNQDESDVDCGGTCNDCPNGDTCNTAADCQSNLCDSGTCAACASDGQCAAAEFCNGGVCVPDLPTGSLCTAGAQCVTNNCVDGRCCGSAMCGTCEACNIAGLEGACELVGAGQTDDTCNMAGKQCDAVGACKSVVGQACSMASSCLSNFCVDGVCCNNACTVACRACNVAGSLGTCSNLTGGVDDTFPANVCVGVNSCDAGTCKKDNGQTCASGVECVSGNCVDGRCCNSACTTTCQACNVAGSLGTCSNLTGGVDDTFPANACVGTNSCAAGTCKKDNGQVCGAGAECVSGNCIDGVCCNTACGATCFSCNVAGSVGTCTPNLAGTETSNECNTGAAPTCNGAGACGDGGALGVACVTGGCLSGNCVDGVCCDTTCGGLCEACVASKTGGTNGTCAGITVGTDPDGECSMPGSLNCAASNMCGP